MNIDERLERLTERHEALAQTVELISHQLQEWAAETRDALRLTNQMIVGLVRIVESHEARIDRLGNYIHGYIRLFFKNLRAPTVFRLQIIV